MPLARLKGKSRAQGVFASSSRGTSERSNFIALHSTSMPVERTDFTALHSTSMPAGQQVEAVPLKSMTIELLMGCRNALGKMKMLGGRAQGVFGSSTRGNSEHTNFTALHSTSMPGGQQVEAMTGTGLTI